jgi:hypothetical protein
MRPRYFAAALALVAAIAFASINAHIPFSLVLDPFGLRGGSEPKRILTSERLSKYLLAHRYVPQNFEGVLIGPSLTANLDTRFITGSRLYNLSVNGANVTELRTIFEPAAAAQDSRLRYVVICLNLFMLADSGFKDQTLRWSSPWEAALLSAPSRQATWRLLRGKVQPIFAESEAGWHNFDLYLARNAALFNDDRLQAPAQPPANPKPLPVNASALADLKAVVAAARKAGMQVFAFYYPYNARTFEDALEPGWAQFRTAVETIFADQDVIWDMNTPAYDAIRRDGEAYIDGHVSQRGARLVLQDIQLHLDRHLHAPR